MLTAFTRHPHSVGETYGAHFLFASRFGLRMLAGGFACLLHGLAPFLFVKTGSRTVLELLSRMSDARAPAPLKSLPEPDYLI
jgi:hypothetical protein